MTGKLTTLFAAATIIGSLIAATTPFAEETQSPSQPPRAQGMGDHGGMMNMMGQMSPDHMKQMTAMIDNCNRMMESMGPMPSGPGKGQTPHG